MTNITLARSYLFKSRKRLKILPILLEEEDYSDVIREAQELVELAQKAMLRQVGVDPPKWHDVGKVLLENAALFPEEIRKELPKLAQISKWLRKERELSFYGDIDFIPTEEYTLEEAQKAIEEASFVVEIAGRLIDNFQGDR